MISQRLAARPLLADSLLAAAVLAFQLWLSLGVYDMPADGFLLVEVLTAGALVLRRRYRFCWWCPS
ncbi:hypothetical protein ABZ345_35160 [Lentzea sp. NPDC005914]|uniref:hypothetical protein n=1 Tax=Lentzea sp. NPDC005914 TaxID=3154572 RepID=UPI0034030383